MYAAILSQPKNTELNTDLLRHMMLSMIKRLNVKFRKQYGELVIAADGMGPSWRKEYFPYYKAHRSKKRDDDKERWKEIHQLTDAFKQELRENFPYKFIEVPHAEADDVIATLCVYRSEPVIIISADKDFIQLHVNGQIRQYDPIRDRFLKPDTNADDFLIEHIIRGDRVDGIPNIYSDDDSLITDGKRQVTMTEARFNLAKDEFELDNPKFRRNQILIDLTKCPPVYQKEIMDQFNNSVKPEKNLIKPYMMKHRLRDLLFSIGDF